MESAFLGGLLPEKALEAAGERETHKKKRINDPSIITAPQKARHQPWLSGDRKKSKKKNTFFISHSRRCVQKMPPPLPFLLSSSLSFPANVSNVLFPLGRDISSLPSFLYVFQKKGPRLSPTSTRRDTHSFLWT